MNSTVEILFCMTGALASGLILSRLAKKLDLPAVTAYLIAGVLIGPFCLGRLNIPGLGFTTGNVDDFELISDVALGFIAFTMGNEFRLPKLKTIGKQAVVIAVTQAIITTVFVDLALLVLHFIKPDVVTLPVVLILGAIATATAPAATLMVINQYKAKGKVTDILMPVVALDDAVGLVVFSVSFGVAKALVSDHVDLKSIIVNPMIEIFASLIIGAVMGLLISWSERFFHSRSKRLAISVTFVLGTVAVSLMKFDLGGGVILSFSSLLSCMMLGTVFCNTCDLSDELMERLDRWTAPLFIMFFVISGAELELGVFTNITFVLIGLVYLASRSGGKYLGARWSSSFMKCDPSIVKYLGITLLPQAGVALGMCVSVKNAGVLPVNDVSLICNITLFAILVYEILGPNFTKIALIKAGDIIPENRVSAREAHIAKKTKE